MYLRQAKVKDRIYLSIVKGYRDKDGKAKSKTIKTIGYADTYLDSYDDPITHFTKIAKDMTEKENKENAPIQVKFYPKKRINASPGNILEIGACIPSKYFHYDLGIWDFFERRRHGRKFSADPGRILELLVYNRLTNPASKLKAYSYSDSFPRKCNFSLDDVYRSLTYLNTHSDKLVKNMNETYERVRGKRNLNNIYYDVTNYYFETEIEEGIKMCGLSKENQRGPIVQMGLMLDNDGIPYNFELFEGNTNDCLTLLPVMKKCGLRHSRDRVIVVADKGLNTSDNIAACILDGNGYVFSQSVRKATEELKDWVLDDADYKFNKKKTYKIKSRYTTKEIYIQNNKGKRTCVEVPVREVAFWSKKYEDRIRHKRANTIEKSKRAIENNYVSLAKAHSSLKYAKRISLDVDTGQVATDIYQLDKDKITADERLDGYYCLVTSEVEMDEKDIIEAYRGLWKIEESFRVTKSELSARPVYLSRDDHIKAHFLICYIALFILRLIQKDTNNKYSAAQICEALKNIVGHRLDKNVYHCDFWNEVVDDMSKSIGFDLNHEVFTKKQITEIMSMAKNYEKVIN